MSLENILYELFVYGEWKPDPDFVKGDGEPLSSGDGSYLGYLLNALKPEQTLKQKLSSLIEQSHHWQICLGDDGKVIAILQDTILEIRSKRNNFSNIISRVRVPRDPNPQWRKMAWSPDCSMIAVGASDGNIHFYDLSATSLFEIPADCNLQGTGERCLDTTHAIAGMVFLTCRVTEHKWSSEFLVVDYQGSLRSFFVSPTDGFKLNHKFNFERGCSSLSYHKSHNMIFLTGLPLSSKKLQTANDYGLIGWRLLNDSPYYKESIYVKNNISDSFMSWLINNLSVSSSMTVSVILKTAISPNGNHIACLHTGGDISIWHLPALKLIHIWSLKEQPNYDCKNETINNNPKIWKPISSEFLPIDINWWNDEALIISRCNGSITICSISDLQNVLGNNPEFFQGHPQITQAFENCFLSLECEGKLVPVSKFRQEMDDSSIINKEVLEGNETEDDENESLSLRTTNFIKSILYTITDIERFQPKPKKINVLARIYRLICLRSTTPSDLYLRKIEIGEYDEALKLAKNYDLDSDLVYQQRWRSSNVCHTSISNYLSKISKKLWVIQQCCDRVAETLESAKELLNFGLEMTNEIILEDNSFDKSGKEIKEFLESLTIESLSPQDIEIIRCRYIMLFYLDRLEVYENIINSEDGSYESNEYSQLRNGSLVQMATKLAHEGRVTAITSIWPHLSNVSHQLIVLENLPETLDPMKYRHLLPNINSDVIVYDQETKRPSDWCEKTIFRSIWDSFCDDETDKASDKTELPIDRITEWFIKRVHTIDELCGLPCHSLKLISMAIENGIPGLDAINYKLITLNALVYNVYMDITLEKLDSSSHKEIVKYFTSKSTSEDIVSHVLIYLFPYFERCCQLAKDPALKKVFLKEFVVSLASRNMKLSLTLMKNWQELELSVKDCLDVANEIFMANENNEYILTCFHIYDALPKICDESLTPSYLNIAIDEMEKVLKSLSILDSCGVFTTYANLRKICDNIEEGTAMLTSMANSALKRAKPLKNDELNELLADVLNVRDKLFSNISIEICTEIYVSALLHSAHIPTINATKKLLSSKKSITSDESNSRMIKNKEVQKLSWNKTKDLVLKTAQHYFKSASTISDPALTCAWNCLQILNEEEADIQYEKDLILALRIIEEFELSILPMQVHMFESKFWIIQECLACNNRAYKFIERILLLAKYLHIEDNEKKRELLVISVCAEKALEMSDFDEANILSKRLLKVSSTFPSELSAVAAQKLGSCADIGDPSLRFRLINLALLNCEPQHIEPLLQTRLSVEAEMLQFEINNLINVTNVPRNAPVNLQDSIESTEDDFSDALTSPQNENRTIIGVMERYIQKPLTVIGDKWNLKDKLNFNWLNKKSEFKEDEKKQTCLNDIQLNCHSFYMNLHDEYHPSSLSLDYTKFTPDPVCNTHLLLLQAFVRNELLQSSFSLGFADSRPLLEALVQCGEIIMSEDTALSISHLLSAVNFLTTKDIPVLSVDLGSIKTLLYFYAILCNIEKNNIITDTFIMPPYKLIEIAEKHLDSTPIESHSKVMKHFAYCLKSLNEIREGEKLAGLISDVDVSLFIKNDEYRKDIILELSRSFSNKNITTAIDLANKYEIDLCELGLTHITFVILHYDEIGIAETNALLKNEVLLESFKNNSQVSLKWIMNNVWDVLNGCDHQGLIICLNVLISIDGYHLINNLNVKDHLKLIKKARSACSEINYKYLITTPLEGNLIGLLGKENVGLVAKLLRNLPAALNVDFDSSHFFNLWLTKYFFNIPPNVMSSKKWLQQYRECSGYFNKLKTVDLLSFTREILFNHEALENIPASTRIQIAVQTEEYCHHEYSNNDYFNSQIKSSENDWNTIADKIAEWGKFLEKVHSEKISLHLRKFKQDFPEIFLELEHSRGEKVEMMGALKFIFCYNGVSSKELVDSLDELDCGVKIEDIILYITNEETLSQSELSMISQRIIELSPKYKFSDEVLERIKPYANSEKLSSQQRLGLLRLFKTDSDNQESDVLIKITHEIITNTWSEVKSDEYKDKNLANENERIRLIVDLLSNTTTWDELKSVIDLVNMWPQISENTNDDSANDVCRLILIKLLEDINKTDENIPLLKLFLEKHNINPNKIKSIITKDLSNPIGKLWLCLLTNHDVSSIINQLKDVKDIDNHANDDLILMLLNNGLFITMIRTPLYPFMTQMLINASLVQNPDCKYSIKQAIADLTEKKFYAEAGSLSLTINNVPRTLRTFTASVFVGKQHK